MHTESKTIIHPPTFTLLAEFLPGQPVNLPVAHQSIHSVVTGTKASQLHFLPVPNFFSVAITPFDWHIRVCICIYKDIECTGAVQLRKKGHRRGYLAEDSLDLGLDFFLCLVWGWTFVTSRANKQSVQKVWLRIVAMSDESTRVAVFKLSESKWALLWSCILLVRGFQCTPLFSGFVEHLNLLR